MKNEITKEIIYCAIHYRGCLIKEKGAIKGLLKFKKQPINFNHFSWRNFELEYSKNQGANKSEEEIRADIEKLFAEAVDYEISEYMSIPNGLTKEGIVIAKEIKKMLLLYGFWFSGGCTIFNTVQAYRGDESKYNEQNNFGFNKDLKCELVVCYDGADAKYMFEPWYYIEEFYFFDIFAKKMKTLDIFWEKEDNVTTQFFTNR